MWPRSIPNSWKNDCIIQHRNIQFQRTVVHARGQTEPMFGQGHLATKVTFVHRPDLRNRDMRFVDDEEEVLREVVDEAIGRAPLLTAIDMAGVILDTSA